MVMASPVHMVDAVHCYGMAQNECVVPQYVLFIEDLGCEGTGMNRMCRKGVWVGLVWVLLTVAGSASAADPQVVLLTTPGDDSCTIDFVSTETMEDLTDGVRYFVVLGLNLQDEAGVEEFNVRLSASPTMRDYEGYARYLLFGVALPGLPFIGTDTATSTTASSSSISRSIAVNFPVFFAFVGVAVLETYAVDYEIDMSLRVSLD